MESLRMHTGDSTFPNVFTSTTHSTSQLSLHSYSTLTPLFFLSTSIFFYPFHSSFTLTPLFFLSHFYLLSPTPLFFHSHFTLLSLSIHSAFNQSSLFHVHSILISLSLNSFSTANPFHLRWSGVEWQYLVHNKISAGSVL